VTNPPRWYIRFGYEPDTERPPTIIVGDAIYRLSASYTYGRGELGLEWIVYRRVS
jgi:hypothetical protein